MLTKTEYRDQPLHRRFRAIVQRIPAGSRVLDIACGSGTLMAALRDRNCTVHGLDINPKAIALTRSKGLDAIVGDADEFASDPDVRAMLLREYDAVIFSKCLMHLRRKNELIRLLRTPRIFVVQTNPLRWKTRLRRLLGRYGPDTKPYLTADGNRIDARTMSGLRRWSESYGYRLSVALGSFFRSRDAVFELTRKPN